MLLSTDKNIAYQQKFKSRQIAIVVLGQGRWSLIKPHVTRVAAAVDAAIPGSYVEFK